MNTNILGIVKRIVAEQGEDILDNSQRLKAFFVDYAKDEPQQERLAFGRSIEMGFYKELKNAAAGERQRKKTAMADQLHAKTGVDKAICSGTLDLLEIVIFGKAQNNPGKAQDKAGKDKGQKKPSPADVTSGGVVCPSCGTFIPAATAPGKPAGQPAGKAPSNIPEGYEEIDVIDFIIGNSSGKFNSKRKFWSHVKFSYNSSTSFLFDSIDDKSYTIIFDVSRRLPKMVSGQEVIILYTGGEELDDVIV